VYAVEVQVITDPADNEFLTISQLCCYVACSWLFSPWWS